MHNLSPKLEKLELKYPEMKDHVELTSNSYQHSNSSSDSHAGAGGRTSSGGADSSSASENAPGHWSKMAILDTLTSKNQFNAADNTLPYKLAINASWLVNIFLLAAKMYVVIVSSSKAVTASLADSAVDLISQLILSLADIYMNKHNANYPVGRSRLEALSVIACAFIMCMASVEVIQFSAVDLFDGLNGNKPTLEIDTPMYAILVAGIVAKMLLYGYCTMVNKALNSDIVDALAEDHLNDVWSNSVAIATAAVAVHTTLWWFDPMGAILISVVIIYRWYHVIWEQVKKIAGHTAPKEFIDEIEQLAGEHDVRIDVDCTRVYHFGARFNVEMEIVLPGSMTVRESHDIALALQHKIESFKDVERAFVHVDHEKRDGLEHKVERELVMGMLASNSADAVSSPFSPGWTEAGGAQKEGTHRRPGKGLLTGSGDMAAAATALESGMTTSSSGTSGAHHLSVLDAKI